MAVKKSPTPIAKKDFLELVKKEASAIRKHATKDERNKLDLETLNANSSTYCVYGQMTGSCWCERATELISKTKAPAVDALYQDINRVKIVATKAVRDNYRDDFTPLESYIFKAPDNKKNQLINFIKGKKKTFNPAY